jgi:hypothetical protein
VVLVSIFFFRQHKIGTVIFNGSRWPDPADLRVGSLASSGRDENAVTTAAYDRSGPTYLLSSQGRGGRQLGQANRSAHQNLA